MCSQDDAPDTKKHFTRAPVQDGSLPRDLALLSILEATFFFFFFSPRAETPAVAAASHHVILLSKILLVRGDVCGNLILSAKR